MLRIFDVGVSRIAYLGRGGKSHCFTFPRSYKKYFLFRVLVYLPQFEKSKKIFFSYAKAIKKAEVISPG